MERIHVDVPEQPPVGSVVLDSAGTAWQRRGAACPGGQGRWRPAHTSAESNGLSWVLLLCEHGPLDLVHRAEGT